MFEIVAYGSVLLLRMKMWRNWT